MKRITVRFSDDDYRLIEQLAQLHRKSLADEIRYLIRNGALFDVPNEKLQVATACAVEVCLLLRKLASLRDSQMVEDAKDEAKQLLDTLEPRQ